MRNFFLGVIAGIILLHASHTSAFGSSDLHMAADSLKSISQTLKLIDYKLDKSRCR